MNKITHQPPATRFKMGKAEEVCFRSREGRNQLNSRMEETDTWIKTSEEYVRGKSNAVADSL